MANTLIQVEHLSRNYGPLTAVSDISFELKQGEVLGFLGPNGAGKSTSMQIITGNLAPSQGTIKIGGIDLLEQPKLAKAEIGYLPEQPPLYRELSVDEFLSFSARINRISRNHITNAVTRAKQRCGLEQVGKRIINNLSKGYQQRVGIAQAIIHSPSIVVLDEPTVGLDPIQIREIRELIRELGKEHGVILSTHILPEVQMTCDRVQIINRGQLVFADKIGNLNQRMLSSSLVVGLHNDTIDTSQLESIPGVKSVEDLSAGRWRLHFEPGNSPAEEVAQVAATNNWGLFELSPEHKTLEQIFVDITTTEQQSNEGKVA
ncbi:MAG: ATP-binding cassette domain-containing protein [Gammaproteobacteria bacterium]